MTAWRESSRQSHSLYACDMGARKHVPAAALLVLLLLLLLLSLAGVRCGFALAMPARRRYTERHTVGGDAGSGH